MKQRKWKGKIKNTIENERKLKTTNEKEKKKEKHGTLLFWASSSCNMISPSLRRWSKF